MAVPSGSVDGDQLDEEQIALVLRRASELDGQSADLRPGLDLVVLEEAAVEAGLSRESVRRAVAELRSGTLAAAGSPAPGRSGLGSRTVTASRCVPGPAGQVDGIMRRFLADEQFVLRRDFGATSSWARRRDVGARVKLQFDKSVLRRLLLRDAEHVELAVVEEPGERGMVMVRLAVDVEAYRRAHRVAIGQGAGVGAAVAAAGMVLLGMPESVVVAPAVTGAGVLVGHRLGALRYKGSVDELETGMEGFLDGVERRGTKG